MTVDIAWFQHAACRGIDPEVFFPDRGSPSKADVAKTVCAGCPVRETCLEWAIVNNEDRGVWGGLHPRERKAIRRTRNIGRRPSNPAKCGTHAGWARHYRTGTTPCDPCKTARRTYENARRHPDSNAA